MPSNARDLSDHVGRRLEDCFSASTLPELMVEGAIILFARLEQSGHHDSGSLCHGNVTVASGIIRRRREALLTRLTRVM